MLPIDHHYRRPPRIGGLGSTPDGPGTEGYHPRMSQPRRLVWIRRAILVVVGAELLWLVGVNVFLNTPLAPWAINRKPERWQVTWESAYSLYPARLQTSGLAYTQHTPRVDVEVRATSSSTRLAIAPLLGRTLRFDDMTVEGLSVVITRREQRAAAAPAGDVAPPRSPPAVPDPSHDRGPGWTLRFPGLKVSDVERFMFEDLEVTGGQAEVTADFEVQVRSEMAIRNAGLRWDGAAMGLKGEPLASAIDLGFSGSLGPWNPKETRGAATLTQLSGDLEVSGSIGSLLPIQVFFAGAKWIERLDGSGDVDALLKLEDGRLLPGTRLDLTAQGLQLDFLGFTARGAGRVGADVGGDGGGGRSGARIEVAFDSFSVARGESPAPLAEGTGLTLSAAASELRVGSLEGTTVVLDLPRSSVPDVTFLNAMIPEGLGVDVTQGSATFGAHIEFDGSTEEAQGEITLNGDDLAGTYRDMEYRLDLALSTQLSGRDLDDFEIELEGTTLKLENGRFESEHTGVGEGWWMTVKVPKGHADLAAPLAFRADVDLSMQDTRAVVALFAEIKHWLRYVKKILTVSDVEGSAVVGLDGGKLWVRSIELTGDKLDALGELEVEGKALKGIVWLKYGVLGLALDRGPDATDWKLVKARKWYDARRAAEWPSPAASRAGRAETEDGPDHSEPR